MEVSANCGVHKFLFLIIVLVYPHPARIIIDPCIHLPPTPAASRCFICSISRFCLPLSFYRQLNCISMLSSAFPHCPHGMAAAADHHRTRVQNRTFTDVRFYRILSCTSLLVRLPGCAPNWPTFLLLGRRKKLLSLERHCAMEKHNNTITIRWLRSPSSCDHDEVRWVVNWLGNDMQIEEDCAGA